MLELAKKLVDPFVGGDIGDEIVHHGVDSRLPAQTVVQGWRPFHRFHRGIHHLGCLGAGRQGQGGRDGQQTVQANGSKHGSILQS